MALARLRILLLCNRGEKVLGTVTVSALVLVLPDISEVFLCFYFN